MGGSFEGPLDYNRKTYHEDLYQREQDICMKSILESAVELYQNALRNKE